MPSSLTTHPGKEHLHQIFMQLSGRKKNFTCLHHFHLFPFHKEKRCDTHSALNHHQSFGFCLSGGVNRTCVLWLSNRQEAAMIPSPHHLMLPWCMTGPTKTERSLKNRRNHPAICHSCALLQFCGRCSNCVAFFKMHISLCR